MTLGVVLLLFCVYELFWTGLSTDRAQESLQDDLRQRWLNDPKATIQSFEAGDGIGIMRIPRLGADWSWVVVQGVTVDALKDGPGHYPGTALPGEIGNFAVAGHRATNGEPFAYLDKLRRGDEVIVETKRRLYTYRVQRHEITDPTAVSAVLPVPNRPGVRATQRRITLTTCEPRYGSTHRLIYYGKLASAREKLAPGTASGR